MKGFKMKNLLLLSGIVALTMSCSAFAAPVSPCPGPCPMPCPEAMSRPCPMFDAERPEKPHCDKKKFIEDLNLSKKQQEQVEQLKAKEKDAIAPLKEQISVKKQEIDAICNERLTVKERQEKLQPVNNEIRELRKQIHEVKVQYRTEFEKVLNDKQLKKLQDLKQQRKHDFHKRHRDGMHRRPPMPPMEEK